MPYPRQDNLRATAILLYHNYETVAWDRVFTVAQQSCLGYSIYYSTTILSGIQYLL